jgi:hypothetical protein
MKRAADVPLELIVPLRLPRHAMQGTLLLDSSKRVISHRLTDMYDLIICDTPVINIPLLSVRITDTVARGVFLAYYYSYFCIGTGDPNPTKPALAGAMLGLLFNTIDSTRILEGNNELVGHCLKADFNSNFIEMNTVEEIAEIADSDRVQSFLAKFGGGLPLFLGDQAQQYVMLGPILLTIWKNIQVEGYIGWLTRRIRAFIGTLGLESGEIIWTDYVSRGVHYECSRDLPLSILLLTKRDI